MIAQIGRLDARERILTTSSMLFSQKGYDATRVNEIAIEANVNKALIYYYFESKEDILNTILASIYKDFSALLQEYSNKLVGKMAAEGYLTLSSGRFVFSDDRSRERFIEGTHKFYGVMVDYSLEHREALRILMIESLKHGSSHDGILKFFHTAEHSPKECARLSIVDKAATSQENVNASLSHYFFFVLLPIISFAAYYDDYKGDKHSLKADFLASLHHLLPLGVM